MGNFVSRITEAGTRGVKRKHIERNLCDESSDNESGDQDSISDSDSPPTRRAKTVDIHTPKRKHIKSTSKYIFETLFLKGENSDVTIRALDHDWLLHRHYLKQSGYFSGMLSGSWKESNQDVIQLDIPDSNIDKHALKIAFGCLYKDDVVLKPVDVIGVVAAASLLQLEGLIKQCIDFMKETIGASTVVTYLTACRMYALPTIATFCQDWLLHNIMAPNNMAVLKDISEDLMQSLLVSGDLWVLQVEMDLYTLLKKWIFLRNNPSWTGRRNQLIPDADAFFKKETVQECYLQSLAGRKYIKSFECLRWQYVINDLASVKLIEADRIVPTVWLTPIYRLQWHQLLHIEQGIDKGPQEVSDQVFISRAMRCGRVLPSDKEFCWRWVGYNYGVDSLITYKNRLISIMRNNSSNMNYPGCVSLQPKRSMFIRLTVSNIDETGAMTATKSTGIKRITFDKNESVVLLTLENNFKFPLYVNLCCLLTSPDSSLAIPRLQVALTSSSACQTRRPLALESRPQNISPHGGVRDSDQVDTRESQESDLDNSLDIEPDSQSLSPQAESLLDYLRRSRSRSLVSDDG